MLRCFPCAALAGSRMRSVGIMSRTVATLASGFAQLQLLFGHSHVPLPLLHRSEPNFSKNSNLIIRIMEAKSRARSGDFAFFPKIVKS